MCRRLKTDSRTAGVPVIFLSALTDTASRVKGLDVGALDFISKPFQPEEVLARVRTHLLLGRTMAALDEMCSHLEQAVLERSADLDQVSAALRRQVAAHRETTRQLRLASRAIESAHDAIVITDSTGVILAANPASLALTEYSVSDLVGRRVLDLLEPGAFTEAPDVAEAPLRMGSWARELWVRRRSGTVLPVWISVADFRDGTAQVSHHVAVFSDISDRKESEARVQFLAQHDALTGLPNRVLLHDRFDVARAAAHRGDCRLAVLFIDLDKFKTINDLHGHSIGDEYLRIVAQAIGETLRESDTLCRMGGDEFIALLNGIGSPDQVSAIAQRILNRLNTDFVVAEHVLRRTASIGIALYPDDGDTFDGLSRRADTAMYSAKRSGRNTAVFHTEQMNAELLRRIALEAALRFALANDELSVHYQPMVELGTARIVGLEALARWGRPGVGNVPPDNFIPLAEATGLIVDLGQHVARMVCRQIRTWMDAGIAVPVSINVSPVEIWHGRLDETLLGTLRESGVPAELLEVEITESGLVDDTSRTRDLITRLQQHGVRVSIDDFLTGYSNFTYLRQFHPAHVKIDQSFVSAMTPESENHAIVKAAIQMAVVLKIPIIAEGVETAEQRDLLVADGCPVGQGYLFAHPMPVDEVTGLLVRGHCPVDPPPTLSRPVVPPDPVTGGDP